MDASSHNHLRDSADSSIADFSKARAEIHQVPDSAIFGSFGPVRNQDLTSKCQSSLLWSGLPLTEVSWYSKSSSERASNTLLRTAGDTWSKANYPLTPSFPCNSGSGRGDFPRESGNFGGWRRDLNPQTSGTPIGAFYR